MKALILFLLLISLLVTTGCEERITVTGTVAFTVENSYGGFLCGKSPATTIYFTDGTSYWIDGKVELEKGQSYTLTLCRTERTFWTLVSIKEGDK